MNFLRNVITRGRQPGPRGVVAEWTITLAILFFATTTLVQAYVIPTGSMESTILVGDHLLVDKLAYADPGVIGKSILPYREVRRGDIIVFRYPVDGKTPYIKRVVGLPGDRIHMENRQVFRNGIRLAEPYTQHIASWPEAYRDNFPQSPSRRNAGKGARDARESHTERRDRGPSEHILHPRRQPGQLARQPLLGIRASRKPHRKATPHLLVL